MKSAISQRLLAAVAFMLSAFGPTADAAYMIVEVNGVVTSTFGDGSRMLFPASPGQSMRMVYTTSIQAPDGGFSDATTGIYPGAVLSMVLSVGDRTVEITNPFEATSLVQIQNDLFNSVTYRDGYLARYSNPGAQPFDFEADVQLWRDTPDPSDALTSAAYLSAPPSLANYPLAVMNFYGYDEHNHQLFDVIRGDVTSINVVAVPEPATVWTLLLGIAAVGTAKWWRQRRRTLATC